MIRTWRRIIVAALFISSASAAQAAAETAHPCEREMARAARQHGIPLGILYAVGLTETGVEIFTKSPAGLDCPPYA